MDSTRESVSFPSLRIHVYVFPLPLFARSLNQSTTLISGRKRGSAHWPVLAFVSQRAQRSRGGRNREGKTRHLLGKTREQGGHEWLCAFACIDIHQESQSQGRSLLRREREVLTNMETLLKNIEAGNGSRIESFWA